MPRSRAAWKRFATSVHRFLPKWDATARRSLRAAIVIPSLFAFSDKVIGDPNVSTFASIGGFAMLLLADFGGPLRKRAIAYGSLALCGAVFVTIGTLCSRTTWLAVLVAAVVGSAVLFSGILSGYAAKGSIAALLILVLPLTIPAGPSAIGPRLEGWALASVAGTLAVLLLWREPPQAGLGSLAARALLALVGRLAIQVDGPGAPPAADGDAAVERLRAAYLATTYRPMGATVAEQAIVALTQELDWLDELIRGHDDLPADGYARAEPEDRTLLTTSVRALRDAASALLAAESDPGLRWGGRRQLADRDTPLVRDLEMLSADRERAASATAARVDAARFGAGRAGSAEVPAESLECSFHARAIATATAATGSSALVASGLASLGAVVAERARWYGAATAPSTNLGEIVRQSLAHADLRSVWLRNSLRGALGFALAVLVAKVTDVQHGFWVVLGTLAVLRSNALGTGATALRAIAGTTLGFVVGAAILVGLGDHVDALWAVLPVTVLLAGYAPVRISFLAGQAAFTVLLAVLFNIVQPTGWRVGLVRVEDVAIGCGISLVVGVLLWPRGATPVVSLDLADAYRSGVHYLAAAVHELVGRAGPDDAEQPAKDATAASRRLDAAYRGYLAEQGSKIIHRAEIATLVGGSTRLLLTASSLAALPLRGRTDGTEAEVLDGELHELARSLDAIADTLAPRTAQVERRPTGSGEPGDGGTSLPGETQGAVQEAGFGESSPTGACGRWIHHHLSHLLRDVGPLAAAAAALPDHDTARPRHRPLGRPWRDPLATHELAG